MLTPEERTEFWIVFKSSRLFAGQKDAMALLDRGLRRVVLRAGERVFQESDAAQCLYLLVRGTVRQIMRHEGVVLLQRDLGPGDYFGQHSLFGGRHNSEAVALTAVVLYEMGADELRMLLEGDQQLQDELLQEKRARRLRSIPLLRDLTDEEVMRLALVFEEHHIERGRSLPLREKPGLWIIDYGQVGVSGPAGMGLQDWRLTSGNFFLTPDVKFGARCIATQAVARRESHLLYLPVEHSDRLISASPDIGRLVHAPLDIPAALAPIPLFNGKGMTEAHRRHLAQYVGWRFVPDKQNVTAQGAIGHSLVILRDGAAVISDIDDQGRQRPVSVRRKGDYYGVTSLLQGTPRGATVRAVIAPAEGNVPGVRGADVLTLDRRDLQVAFADRRDLWRSGVELFDRFQPKRGDAQLHAWQSEGEAIIWYGRGHIFWLLFPELALVLTAVVLLLLTTVAPPELRRPLMTVWFIILGILVLIGVWFVVNYYDDYYIVTNRRVTRRDRQLLLFAESLMEAPIESVQDVTINADFWGRLFDFGDLTIRTAAKVGAIMFSHAPEPEQIKRAILEGKARALASVRGQQKELLRRGLMTQLRLVLPVSDRQPALGSRAEAGSGEEGDRGSSRLPSVQNTWIVRAWRYITQPLPGRLRRALNRPFSQVSPVSGQIVMRKHPIALLKRAWAPFLTTVLLIVALWWLPQVALFFRTGTTGLFLGWLFLMVVSAGWLWWQFIDYRNDIYVLTDEKIIDIEMKPLGLQFKQREGSLERVQSVDARQEGLLPLLLNYGNVIIRTAAADEGYDFVMVPRPKFVQGLVFQKLDALRQRQEAKKTQERQRELIESFQVYDDLRGYSSGPR